MMPIRRLWAIGAYLRLSFRRYPRLTFALLAGGGVAFVLCRGWEVGG